MRGTPVQRFPGPAVHQVCDPIELLLAVGRQICTLWQELANQAIGVLIGASLPRAVRITKIHRNSRIGAELLMIAHLFASVIGQGLSHGLCHSVELVSRGLQDVRRRSRIGVRQFDQYQ